nr:RNA-directed DNA polymerase, eukaryota [Tanacetum cinerariifolium]
PTEEFQFYKGLKQGDPLSPFLFILVMKSLHISFQRVVDVGLFKVLDCFNRASGLRINMTKSKLLGISMEDDKVKQVSTKIGCNTLKTPFSYLGSKVGGCMSRIQSWNETIKRMAFRLSKWKLKILSIGSRLNLLKYVLGSMPIYHMSLFKVPKKVLHRMESMRSHFFNGAELSIKSRVIKALHGYDGKIGQKVKSCYPSLYALETQKKIDVASKLSHSGLDVSFRRPPKGGVEIQQFEHMKENVEGCILVDMMDRWFWALEGSGEFTITSVRKMTDDFMLPEVSSKMHWIKTVPINVNVHAWKVKLDGLPTRLNISRRGIDIESILCPMCGKAVESTSHIFFTCQMSKEILRKISRWWDIDYIEISFYEEWLDWILNTRLSVKSKELFEGVCYVLWWHVWSFRNKTIFDSQIPSKAMIIDDVVSRSFYWLNFQKRTKVMLSSKWNTLNHNCQKFNAIYKRCSRLTKSGESELDVMKQARGAYRDENKNSTFAQEDAWKILRKHAKWDAPAPVDLTEDEEISEVNTDELFGPDARPRPPGKQRPEKKTKSDTSVSTGGSSSSSQFGEIMTKELRLKRKAAEAVFEVAKEKDRTVMRLEEMKFLAISTKDFLKFHPKWDAPEQVDLTGDVPGATQEDLFGHDALPRPAGKPRPAKKTKSDATASTGGSNASTQFGKVMEHELRMKREAAERAFEAQVEKDRTLTRLEELRFLATSIKDLDDVNAYWIKKQK